MSRRPLALAMEGSLMITMDSQSTEEAHIWLILDSNSIKRCQRARKGTVQFLPPYWIDIAANLGTILESLNYNILNLLSIIHTLIKTQLEEAHHLDYKDLFKYLARITKKLHKTFWQINIWSPQWDLTIQSMAQ